MLHSDTDAIALFKEDPRSFRRHLAKDGLFVLLPLQGGDDYRNDEALFTKVLFRGVIDRALLDIISFKPKFNKKKQKQVFNKFEREALEWIGDIDEDGDFVYVCELADLDPSLVRTCILKLKKIKDDLSKGGKRNIYKRKKQRKGKEDGSRNSGLFKK